jgi:hypothetical protein
MKEICVQTKFMKKLAFLLIAAFSIGAVSAQSLNPVSWTFHSKKLGEGVYEIQMIATIEKGWHVYAQEQPRDAIAIPTSFSFNKNPLVNFDGKVKEVGKLEKYKDKVLGVTSHQYSDKVVFVQKVKLKGKAKTNVTGKLEFQTCNDEKCLPPKTVNLSIAL